MRVYLRGKTYWFDLEYRGQEYRKSTKSKNKRLAEQVASAFHTALIRGEVGITERKTAPKFSAAMKSFLTWSVEEHHEHPGTPRRSKTSSVALVKYFGATPLDKISRADVEQFKTVRAAEKGKRTDRKLRPATVNRELACLREMFNCAIKEHPDLRNPVRGINFLAENNQQERVVTFAEQRAYLAVATEMLRDVAGMIVNTGMRPEEVYTLQVPAVKIELNYLLVLKGKTPAARRRIELTAETREILERRIEEVEEGYLFPCETDSTRPIPKVANAHDRAIRDSGVAPFRLYDLRHTWATRAAESGIDLVTLAAMMGHSRIQMVMRYAHPTQIHQTSAMEKLTAFNIEKEAREKARAKLEAAKREGKPTLHVISRSA